MYSRVPHIQEPSKGSHEVLSYQPEKGRYAAIYRANDFDEPVETFEGFLARRPVTLEYF
jgi:hypothetical protein